jgi:hypothetical protein
MSSLSFRTILCCSLSFVILTACGGRNTATPALVEIRQAPIVLAPTDTHRPSPTQPLTFTPIPSASPTGTATQTPSPTPLFVFDLTGYDLDLFQPIEVEHHPPLIAQADETVQLVFNVINPIYCAELERYCQLEPVLYYAYGESEAFQSMPLTYEVINELNSLVGRLPAADQAGGGLRYYAEFSAPEAGYTQRYPVGGVIEVFAAPSLTAVELPVGNEVTLGEKVYTFFWGHGPKEVGLTLYSPYGHRAGPPALDVASNGSIALMDAVNERIILFNPDEDHYSSIPLPFTYKFSGNLAFDPRDRLMVCDFQGEEDPESGVNIPYCYRLLPSGEIEAATPLYAKFPEKLTREHLVVDYYDSRSVAPFNPEGEANSREDQRQKLAWELPYRFVEDEQGLSPFTARFADIQAGVAFEVHAEAGLGVILGFERTPQGYVMIFSSGYEQIRAVWIDAAGMILKDVTLPNGQYSELSFDGQAAVAEDGSLYVLSSTERGVEIHFEGAP